MFGFVLPVSWGANYLLNRFVPCRATREGERQGMGGIGIEAVENLRAIDADQHDLAGLGRGQE